MTEKAIQNIYNKLLNSEGKHAPQPYPIHKKLNTEDFGYCDIYEWIADSYKFNHSSVVLDAGCGVGYGSLFLAKQYNCEVKGISLSDAEIKKAKTFAKKEHLEHKISFKHQSYDDLDSNSFDFIMAIESVKHTLDLDQTINSLKNALKPNGVLVIVDDFLISENQNTVLKTYAKDWKLKVLLKANDFLPEFSIKKDLTPFIKTKNQIILSAGICALTLLKPVYDIASIMRGGLYLEILFKRRMMTYYALEFKKS